MTTWTPAGDDPPSNAWTQENIPFPTLFSPLVFSQMVIGGKHLFSGASSELVWNRIASPSSTWTAE